MYFCIPVFSSLIANSKHPQDSTEFQQVIGPDMQQVFDTPTKWGPFEKCMDIDEDERNVGRKIKTARENINGGRKKRNQLWRYSGYSNENMKNGMGNVFERISEAGEKHLWRSRRTKAFNEEKRNAQQNMLRRETKHYQRVFGLKWYIAMTAEKVGEFQFDINSLDDE